MSRTISALDFAALADMVREARGKLSQEQWGETLVPKLTQGQVSKLETQRMRDPSHAVMTALEHRFGDLPRVKAPPAQRLHVHPLGPTLSLEVDVQDKAAALTEAFERFRSVYWRRTENAAQKAKWERLVGFLEALEPEPLRRRPTRNVKRSAGG